VEEDGDHSAFGYVVQRYAERELAFDDFLSFTSVVRGDHFPWFDRFCGYDLGHSDQRDGPVFFLLGCVLKPEQRF